MQKTLKRYFPIFVVPTLIAFAFEFIIPFIEGVYPVSYTHLDVYKRQDLPFYRRFRISGFL